MKKIRRFVSMLLCGMMVVSMVACGSNSNSESKETTAAAQTETESASAVSQEGASYDWILALSVDEDSIPYATANKFSELLAEKSGGRMVAHVYPNGQMGGDTEIVESVQSGAYAFMCNMPSSSSAIVPEGAIFDLHGCFTTVDQARTAVDSEEFMTLINKAYNQYNFNILGFSDLGFRMLTSSREISSLADLKGFKVRVMENPHQIAFWNALGASATPLAWGETYLGLQQHTVDGCEQPYDFIVSARLYEVQSYVYRTNHLFQYALLAMNNDQYRALPDADREIVDEAAAEACQYGRDLIDGRIEERAAFIESQGVTITDAPDDVMEMIGQVSDNYADEIISYCGEELYNTFVKSAGN